jgi:hypothetical protein
VAQLRAPSSRLRLARGLTPPSSGSRLARGFTSPSSGLRLARGLTLPSSEFRLAQGFISASLEAPHEHTRSRTRVRAFNALTQQSRAIIRLGITPRRCSANSLRGNPSPPLWGTVGHGQCQLCGTVPPTPVRLTRRALESRPAAPSNHFLVNLQGQAMTLGLRNAIPVTIDPARSPPCLQHHAGHCHNNPGAVGRTGTGRRHACHCIPYGSPSTASSSPPEDATANHYALTLEAATVRVQDTP